MVNFLEALYVLALALSGAAIVFLFKRRRSLAFWFLFAAFVVGICAALLYVRLTPATIAIVSGDLIQ